METEGVEIGLRKIGLNQWSGLYILCGQLTTLPARGSREKALEDALREARRVYAERLDLHFDIEEIRTAFTPVVLAQGADAVDHYLPPHRDSGRKTIVSTSPFASVLDIAAISRAEGAAVHASDEIAALARTAEQIDPELADRAKMLARALDLYSEVLRRRGIYCSERSYRRVLESLFSGGLACTVCLKIVKNQLMQEDNPTETLRDFATMATRAYAQPSDVGQELRYYEVRRDVNGNRLQYNLLMYRFDSEGLLQAEPPALTGPTLAEVRKFIPEGLNRINPLRPGDVNVIEAWF